MAGLTKPQPLTAAHDLSLFDCGRDSLNLWLHRRALGNQESGVSRTSVICDGQRVAGFVALSTAQIERAFLPKSQQRNRPDPLPAILLGQLAVDREYQGKGVARSLLIFALTTAVRLSEDIGCFCVLTHPLDNSVRQFYRNFGFEDLPFDPAHSMAVRIADLKHNGF